MGVIDFGAVAPLPGGLPTAIGEMISLARDKNYDKLLPVMEEAGFIQPGEEVPIFEVDNMPRQYVEPIQTEVFHYTRRWIMKMAAGQLDNGVNQIKMARQLDMPEPGHPAAGYRLDRRHLLPAGRPRPRENHCHGTGSGLHAVAHGLPAVARRPLGARERPRNARQTRCVGVQTRPLAGQAATTSLRGRPRGRLRAMTAPRSRISPPQTPHGSSRSSASLRHWRRIGQSAHSALACSS